MSQQTTTYSSESSTVHESHAGNTVAGAAEDVKEKKI